MLFQNAEPNLVYARRFRQGQLLGHFLLRGKSGSVSVNMRTAGRKGIRIDLINSPGGFCLGFVFGFRRAALLQKSGSRTFVAFVGNFVDHSLNPTKVATKEQIRSSLPIQRDILPLDLGRGWSRERGRNWPGIIELEWSPAEIRARRTVHQSAEVRYNDDL